MSLSDIKHSLRKLEFPATARESLVKLEQLLVGRAAPTSKQLDNAMEIISEFVFCEADRRGSRRGGGLNPLQELQLIDVICNYLSACSNETTKNTIFLSLFGGMESPRRLKILCILASMAISASSISVLLAVGVWLQQMGCSSPQSLQLVENIIRDHFYLNTTNQTALKSLANAAPQFVSNFITAVTELYLQDTQNPVQLPPKNLLEVITAWVYSTPSLCMSAQLNAAALPIGAIPMAAVSPLAGLVRWCALAPLYIDEDADIIEIPAKKIKIEGEKCALKTVNKPQTESQLYIQLQLGVLQSMRAWRRRGPPAGIGVQRLAALITPVNMYAHRLIERGCKFSSDQKLQDCLDRIGQSLQVALANGCVYGNISSLLASLDTLPENRLLKIVIKAHQQAI